MCDRKIKNFSKKFSSMRLSEIIFGFWCQTPVKTYEQNRRFYAKHTKKIKIFLKYV